VKPVVAEGQRSVSWNFIKFCDRGAPTTYTIARVCMVLCTLKSLDLH
jgi:hypothetical protein